MKRSHPLVLKRLQSVPVDDGCMSVITRAELLYGVEVSPRRAHDAAALAAFLPDVEAVEFDEGAALHYAEIRADLKRRGAMIGANDLFIAAHARALGLTLVTNNTAEFEGARSRARELGSASATEVILRCFAKRASRRLFQVAHARNSEKPKNFHRGQRERSSRV